MRSRTRLLCAVLAMALLLSLVAAQALVLIRLDRFRANHLSDDTIHAAALEKLQSRVIELEDTINELEN